MSRLDLAAAARAAEAAADAARREILPRFRRVAVETKADGSPVTEADRAAERAIREVLRAFDPEIGILGEEYGEEPARAASPAADSRAHAAAVVGAGLRWIVDPIDGTIGFTRGIPLFGTLIALLEDGEAVLGLIDLPAIDDRVVGWRGGGVTAKGAPVRCSQREDLRAAIVAHGDPFAFELFGARPAWERMAGAVNLLRGYTDAFGHAMVVRGAVDAMVDVSLSPWDVAATQCLVREAGGRCETLDRTAEGKKLGLVFGSPPLVEVLADWLRQGCD